MGSPPRVSQLLGPETRGQAARRGGQDVFLAPQVAVCGIRARDRDVGRLARPCVMMLDRLT